MSKYQRKEAFLEIGRTQSIPLLFSDPIKQALYGDLLYYS